MKKSKKIFLLFLLIGCIQLSFSQKIDTRYLVSIIYLQNNKNLHKEIKSTFKKEFSKKKPIAFTISNKISFIGIAAFYDEIKKLKPNNNLLNSETFYNENNFSPIENHFKEILPFTEKNIKIHFSKPVHNILIFELSPKELNNSFIKFGTSIKVLLFFNNKGMIKDCVFKTFINN